MTTITMDINKEKKLAHTFPKVSIIVATYRRKESLEKALQSLINQTYGNFEIILIDDNADNKWNTEVEKIVKNFKNKKEIIYIKNENNKGSAETRNIGIRSSTGEYVTFLDDDDVYFPEKVYRQVEHMLNEGSDFSLTDLWLYDEEDRLIEKRNRRYVTDFSSESLIRYHLLHHMTGTDVMMFKKKYLLDIGLFSPVDVGDEFHLISKAIIKNGVFSYLPTCDVKAYIHTKTDGLSSGEGKINGEKKLYDYKKTHFDKLTTKEQKYVKMRHYAVLAYAEFRRKRYLAMTNYALCSFFSLPYQFVILFLSRK
ncbi:glycosyltransferase family 2 protein [Exiguobacterium sp. SH5S13]|uniref:glycosyltransferase family 2 protein n=1 Tax=Exiguobacterium sp. SH5S13 TaxID=2510959 RepID=UPI00103FD11E|nr:glycosyltransferase family 2 protein [Exiguobacterium sp. SH5S13]TCI49904.1 glycosyltransferase family 2 protein [Exiguobacterium sp. SH5S13]